MNCENLSNAAFDIISPLKNLSIFKEIIEMEATKDGDGCLEVDYQGMLQQEREKNLVFQKFLDEFIIGNVEALHRSVEMDSTEIISYLIEKGADINRFFRDITPFQHAIGECHSKKVIEFLIEKGGNIKLTDKKGRRLIDIAIEKCNNASTDTLLSHGADIRGISLDKLLRINNHQINMRLIEDGIDAKQKSPDYEFTPLHLAAEVDNAEMCEYLIKQGADIEAVDKFGCTPLFGAVESDSVKAAEVLIKANANTRVTGTKKISLIEQILIDEKAELFKVFLQNGCIDIDSVDKDGRNILIKNSPLNLFIILTCHDA